MSQRFVSLISGALLAPLFLLPASAAVEYKELDLSNYRDYSDSTFSIYSYEDVDTDYVSGTYPSDYHSFSFSAGSKSASLITFESDSASLGENMGDMKYLMFPWTSDSSGDPAYFQITFDLDGSSTSLELMGRLHAEAQLTYSDLFYDWEYLYYHRRSADSASDGGISVCWWLCRYLWPSAFPWIIVFLVINERKCFLRLLLPILWLLCWLIWARLLVMFLPPLALYVLPLSMNLCFCLRLVSCLSEAVSVSSDVCSPVADCKRPRPDGFSRAGAFPCLRGVFHGYAV